MTKKEFQETFLKELDGKRSASDIADVALKLTPLEDTISDLTLNDLTDVPDFIYGNIVSRLEKKQPLSDIMKRSVVFVLGKQAIEQQDLELQETKKNRKRNQCSERVGLIVEPQLWNKVKEVADFYNVSISSFVMDACRQYLDLKEEI